MKIEIYSHLLPFRLQKLPPREAKWRANSRAKKKKEKRIHYYAQVGGTPKKVHRIGPREQNRDENTSITNYQDQL